jgi:putative endonuclease
MDRIELGRRGEEAAATYLVRAGMDVADMNWRTSAGEVDIVAWEGDTLAMVEVKTRRSLRMGTPEEAVSPTKQKRLVRLAREYVAQCERRPASVRFDVVSVTVIAEDRALLRHHRAAFVMQAEA